MLIPTGWIHAVLTPFDSIVFGGNFLHSLNIPMQLHIYEIEKKVKTAEKFRYPRFETINWFAAKKLLQQINQLNVEERRCPDSLLVGLKALLSSLKHWNTEKDVSFFPAELLHYDLIIINLFVVQHKYKRTDSFSNKSNKTNKRYIQRN